jgi:ATP-binding cassette subfamily B protein
MLGIRPHRAAGDRHRTAGIVGRGWLVTGLLWTSAPLATLTMVAVTVAAGVAPTVTALLNRALINGLIPRGRSGQYGPGPVSHGVNGGHLVFLAVLLGCLGLTVAAVPDARRYAQGQLTREAGLAMQDRMYQAINSFPGLSRFESPVFLDKIRLAQQTGSNAVSTLLSTATTCGQSVLTGCTMFVLLIGISPVFAVIVAGMSAPAVAAQVVNSRKSAGLQWLSSPIVRRQAFYAQLLTGARAAKEIRLFGLGDYLHGRMRADLRALNRAQRALDRRVCSIEGLLALLDAAVIAGGLIWVVRQATAGRLPAGDVAMFVMAVIGVQNALGGLVAQLAGFYQSLLLFGHYVDVATAGPDLPLAARPRRLPALRGGIEVRNVWFRYDDAHPWALRDVSMFIPADTSVALVGLNGAGKSTLVKLLCRLYDPGRGSIHWDGVDLRDLRPADLRDRIGAVFQDYMSYDLTAAENIGFGDLAATTDQERPAGRELVEAAARQAGIHEKLANLPHGYDTLLSRIFFGRPAAGEGPQPGAALSGGQWQRLALARALMRVDRDLLILDEPSSGLDAQAEYAVHQSLRRLRQGRTSLLISHRLGAVRDADEIIVIAEGQIAERGSHAELIGLDGAYARLFALQAKGYEADPLPADLRTAAPPAAEPSREVTVPSTRPRGT